MKMSQQKIIVSCLIVLLSVITIVSRTKAECCDLALFIHHNCFGAWCFSYICPDGSVLYGKRYCGVGACNIFGCNCDGGCRRNSKKFNKEEAQKLFLQKHKGKGIEYVACHRCEKIFANITDTM